LNIYSDNSTTHIANLDNCGYCWWACSEQSRNNMIRRGTLYTTPLCCVKNLDICPEEVVIISTVEENNRNLTI
jgi:hypothetical protein